VIKRILKVLVGVVVACFGFATVGTQMGFVGFFLIPIGIGIVVWGLRRTQEKE